MALERQIELAMDAMKASHDTMIGHLMKVRDAVRGEGTVAREGTETKMRTLMRDPEQVEGPTSKTLVPGQPVPDEELGVPGGRDVRGI
jgi:hypothetical protein